MAIISGKEYLSDDCLIKRETLEEMANVIKEKTGETTVPVKDIAALFRSYETPCEPLVITGNGTYTPPAGKHFSTVTANVPASGSVPGEYDLTVHFLEYDGSERLVSGFYTINDGSEYYFDSIAEFTLFDVADADTVVKITMLDYGSPQISGINCEVSGETGIIVVDDIEYGTYTITVKDFTGDAIAYYQEG